MAIKVLLRMKCVGALGLLAACGQAAPSHERSNQRTATVANDSLDTYIGSPADAVSNSSEWYIADAEQDAVFSYSLGGVRRRRIGRRGSGPGELKTPTAVGTRGDRIYVADLGNRRITIFSRDGAYISARNMPRDCFGSSAAGIRANDDAVFVLLKCRLNAGEIELRVVELLADDSFSVVLVDTARSQNRALSPVAFPLFDANADYLVLGDGQAKCLKLLRIRESRKLEPLCVSRATRTRLSPTSIARLQKNSRGLLEVPSMLPVGLAVTLHNQQLYFLHPVSEVRSEWLSVPILTPHAIPVRVTAPLAQRSYFDGSTLLTFSGEAGGYIPRISTQELPSDFAARSKDRI
ncbi:6-bladed beta-propeller [Gemmatimonas sp.]|uniref:6-bladed beta-propeller n=1 Tax=Gemmatimonas sp. TaxID=1962908 RepID=UPI00286B5CA4|nr:6-bladed beta-propeller [Gemmatimonas sp.]